MHTPPHPMASFLQLGLGWQVYWAMPIFHRLSNPVQARRSTFQSQSAICPQAPPQARSLTTSQIRRALGSLLSRPRPSSPCLISHHSGLSACAPGVLHSALWAPPHPHSSAQTLFLQEVFYNGPPARVPPPEVVGTVHAWQSAGTSLPALQLTAEAEAAGSTSAFWEQGDTGSTIFPKSTRCLAHCWCVVVHSLSRVRLFANPWTAARQAYLFFTISRSLLKLMSIELVMPSNHLILCLPFSSCLKSFPASGSFPMSHARPRSHSSSTQEPEFKPRQWP